MTQQKTNSTILVVEDNPSHMKLVATILSRAGYQVLQAGDAASGLQLAREKIPDLVLIDMRLPDRSGLDVVRELKADMVTCAIPMIAASSYLSEHIGVEARLAGCVSFLTKPYHYTLLLDTVASALTNAKKLAEAPQGGPAAPSQ